MLIDGKVARGRILGSVTMLTSPVDVDEDEEGGRIWKRRLLSRHLGSGKLS